MVEAAKVCGVSARTFRGWRREKFTISEEALLNLCKYFSIPFPRGVKHLSDYWYVSRGARKGALRRLKLYGPLGDSESRRKGGLVSQQRRREDPEKYRLLGCKVKKKFPVLKKSEKFAEATGIILGDGGITNGQVRVTLDKRTDKDYAFFVRKLFKDVFGEKPALYKHKHDNGVDLCVSGTDLVEKLKRFDLKSGNKIHRQVGIPRWVWEEISFQKACVRGLMDTDGSYYSYRPTNRSSGENFAICLTSYSTPLMSDVSEVLGGLQIRHTVNGKRLYIYGITAINKYFEVVGSNNSKHESKFLKYFEYREG